MSRTHLKLMLLQAFPFPGRIFELDPDEDS